MITTVKRGDPFPDIPHRGDLLPIGSQISTSPGGELLLLQAPRTWTLRDSMMDPYVYSFPLYLRSDLEVTLPQESVEAFRWRVRDMALGAAERSGVAMPPVHAMAVEFGAPRPLFTVGGVVSNGWDIKQLPVGTIVYSGHPDLPNLMNVWEADGTKQMKHVMGVRGERANGQPVTIHSMPGNHMGEPMPVSSDAVLNEAALRAWRVGKAYKKQQNWCSVFENCLKALGITEQSIGDTSPGHGPGDELEWEQVAALPEGSILFWSYRNHQAYSVYVRDDGARNRAKTRRVWGWNDNGENSHDRMIVAQTPEEPMAWNCPGWALSSMPANVTFRHRHEVAPTVLTEENRHTVELWNYYAIGGFPV